MTTNALVLIACLLLPSAPAPTQTPARSAAKTDPLSGTWIGELSPKSIDRTVDVTFELKFDGKQGVSGTFKGMPNPGDVKIGTFDPKTGALKLQLGKVGESSVLIVLEGKVVKGTATGQLSGEAGDGVFKLAKKRTSGSE
jgi:hypothetical protein